MQRWYVVRSRPNSEDLAAFNLRKQGFRVFLPKYRKTRRHARRIETVNRPLFPGYLFVAFDPSTHAWRSILGTFGVSTLICAGDDPLPVPQGIVEAIMDRADAASIVTIEPRRFAVGEQLNIADGPFAGLSGVFEEQLDENRIVLLLELMSSKVRVRVDLKTLDLAV